MRVFAGALVAISLFIGTGWAQSNKVGLISYGSGELLLDGEPLSGESFGITILEPKQRFATGNGFAEVSLGAENCLRLGPDSLFEIVSADRMDLRFRLLGGSALIDFIQKGSGDKISLFMDEAAIRLDKRGLYRLDMPKDGAAQLKVIRGQATLSIDGTDHKVKGKYLLVVARDQAAPE